jgi:hypothetical protein
MIPLYTIILFYNVYTNILSYNVYTNILSYNVYTNILSYNAYTLAYGAPEPRIESVPLRICSGSEGGGGDE